MTDVSERVKAIRERMSAFAKYENGAQANVAQKFLGTNARTDIPFLLDLVASRDARIAALEEASANAAKVFAAEIGALQARIAELEGALRMEWRTDCYAKERSALYLGGIFIGCITQWGARWRGWFMSDDEGNETGWFKSSDEARASVEAAARSALAKD